MPAEHQGNPHNRKVIKVPQLKSNAAAPKSQQAEALQRGNDPDIQIAEENGGRFDANGEVIFAIHHGVLRVINEGPEHIGGK